mgnify:FL=1|jgi:hypothetical protein
MGTFKICDNKTYDTHKEICKSIRFKPPIRKSWYKISDKSYLWGPNIVSKSSDWNLIKPSIQDGVEVKWVNFLDGEKLYSGELNNKAINKNTLPPYPDYQQVVFGQYSPKHGRYYYKFLGLFKYNEEHETIDGVNFAIFNRIATEF